MMKWLAGILLLSSQVLVAGTTFKGKIKNLTSDKNEEIRVSLVRRCDWFCSVRYWESAKVSVNADGTWKIQSPHSSSGSHTLSFHTKKATAQLPVAFADFNNKSMLVTVLETYPAKIPMKLQTGEDAGDWIRNYVAGRKIEIFEDVLFSTSPYSMGVTQAVTDSFFNVSEKLVAWSGDKDLEYRMYLQTLGYVEGRAETSVKFEKKGVITRDLYTSIPELIVDNSLDDPMFDGSYRGSLSNPYSVDTFKDYYVELEGKMDVTCEKGILKGAFSGVYRGSQGMPFDFYVEGVCKLGSAEFSLDLIFPPRRPEVDPLRKKLHFTSNSISGYDSHFLAIEPENSGFRMSFYK